MTVGAGHSAAKEGADKVGPGPEEPGLPSKKWLVALLCLAGVFAVLGGYDLSTLSGPGSNDAATAAKTAVAASKPAPSNAAPSSTGSPSHRAAAASGRSTRSAARQGGGAASALGVASVAAFGPLGVADGDNPGLVDRIGGNTDQPWYSQWYTTPEFGNLRSGTGFLLDMGKTVTVRDVRLVLGSALGADVQVRVGNAADLADLATVATATDVGGNVQLTATVPAEGRYVLVWCTRLPPDGQGHFQISVYNATVDGTVGT